MTRAFTLLGKAIRRFALCGSLALASFTAGAQPYPAKPVRIVVPFGAGGSTDVLARLVAPRLSESLKQSFVVESMPGADGIVGTSAVARAAPDGYTLLMTAASPLTLAPILQKVPYDPVKDFAPISLMVHLNGVLVVNSALPVRTLQEFAAEARSRPGRFSFGAGTSLLRLIGEQFKQALQADMTVVPYKGTGPQLNAVLGGEVDAVVDPFVGIQHIKAGKLRPLAVLQGSRSPLLPDVPTLEEVGIKGITLGSWTALLAPAGTPPEIVSRLSAEVARIMAQPDLRERLVTLYQEPAGSTPSELASTVQADLAKWRRIATESNFKPN
ncbi:Bug family tripartite tricarboxylate transporter substrate binding protein [Hydrogenophaga intermedia]|uniref:Bug family tripartite tricarboxylate transporter substrate binding protein n=1 Tax=Hydrogenophaga intermedia TaxID=65786 RepID=UPI002044C336|nr:tripartite tricarboxylate transporter substrate binding protein [Hydrogenophaga intermedia]MCM3562720.1 tripartite tricarboxylate transporter substrate binding protein [Hydrogenophaga intermedia]